MEQTLRNIVAKIAETAPTFDATVSMRDGLKVDSIRALEIVFEIEKVLGIDIPEGKYAQVKTFDDLSKLVASLKA
jgi:acyl carrier protein